MSKEYMDKNKFHISSDTDVKQSKIKHSKNGSNLALDRVKKNVRSDNSVFGKRQARVEDNLKSSDMDLVKISDIQTCSGIISVNKDISTDNTVIAFSKKTSIYNDANSYSDKNFELSKSTSSSFAGIKMTMQSKDEDMILIEADNDKKYSDIKKGINDNSMINTEIEGIYKVSPTTLESEQDMKTENEKSINLYINNEVNRAIERGKMLKNTRFDDDLLQFMKKKRLENEDDEYVDREVEDVES